MLRERRFTELEGLLREVERRTGQAIQHELELFLSYRAFYTADPTVGELLEEWRQRDSDSAIARAAKGKHLEAVGWLSRGGKWAQDTTPRALAEMAASHGQAAIEAKAAVRQEPSLLEAYATLVNLARARGDQPECRLVATDALRLWPASRRLRAVLLDCLEPRWGGSWEEMGRVAREAQAHTGENPLLTVLLGFVAHDRGEQMAISKKYPEAIQLYSQALAHGEEVRFFSSRADARERLDDAPGALADLDRALALMPEEPALLVDHATQLLVLGRIAEARADLLAVENLDPTYERLTRLRRRLVQKEKELGHAAYTSGDFARAIEHFDGAVSAGAESADTLYRRALARRKNGDSAGALEDLRASLRLETSFGAARALDELLAPRGDWEEILSVWDLFIASNPGHADAHLERAGSHRHAGHPDQAQADLRRACELGSARACAIEQGSGLRSGT